MTVPSRRPTSGRSILDSPWLSAALVVVVVLVAGAVFVVPGLLPEQPGATGSPSGSAAPLPSGTPGAPTFVRPTPSPAPAFTTHVVRSGDTLNSIAKKYATTARSIAWWNRGAYPSLDPESEGYDPDRLEVGWELVLLRGTVVDENNPPPPIPDPGETPGQ